MKNKEKLGLTKGIIFFIFIFFWNVSFCLCQNIKLKVNGNINIHQNQTLRFKPVPHSITPPSNPSQGDLYFNGSSLFYYDGTEWQAIAQEGDVFFNSNDNTLYYYDGERWKVVKGEGQKTVATRIVAAYDSLDTTCDGSTCSNPRADYTCDGTDDQEEIQKAIDDLGSSGGVVYLLEGTYNITDDIKINKSNISLIGTGAATLLNLCKYGRIYLLQVSRILISQLRIINNTTNPAIDFQEVESSVVTKVWIEGNMPSAITCFNSRYNIFSSIFITPDWAICGLLLCDDSSNNIIFANYIKNGGVLGIGIKNNSINNIILGNIITRSKSTTSTGVGINIEDGNPYNSVIGNNISFRSVGFWTQSDYSIISSNIISGCDYHGVYLANANYNLISSNQVITNKEEGIYLHNYSSRNNIVGNIIFNNGYDGIKIKDNSSYNLLSSNRILDNSGEGINIISGEKNYLVGNYVDGDIIDKGTNTTYTQKEKITIERKEVNLKDGDTLEVAASPQGYLALKATQAITLDATKAISDGKAQGDLLILEGTSDTNTITILNGANVKLGSINRVLGKEDTLTLIWNGNDWVEMDYANN